MELHTILLEICKYLHNRCMGGHTYFRASIKLQLRLFRETILYFESKNALIFYVFCIMERTICNPS